MRYRILESKFTVNLPYINGPVPAQVGEWLTPEQVEDLRYEIPRLLTCAYIESEFPEQPKSVKPRSRTKQFIGSRGSPGRELVEKVGVVWRR